MFGCNGHHWSMFALVWPYLVSDNAVFITNLWANYIWRLSLCYDRRKRRSSVVCLTLSTLVCLRLHWFILTYNNFLIIYFFCIIYINRFVLHVPHKNKFLQFQIQLQQLTQILQMYSNLVHSTSLWLAKHHARIRVHIETQSFENRWTVLAFRRHLAHAYLVAHHFYRFLAFYLVSEND